MQTCTWRGEKNGVPSCIMPNKYTRASFENISTFPREKLLRREICRSQNIREGGREEDHP